MNEFTMPVSSWSLSLSRTTGRAIGLSSTGGCQGTLEERRMTRLLAASQVSQQQVPANSARWPRLSTRANCRISPIDMQTTQFSKKHGNRQQRSQKRRPENRTATPCTMKFAGLSLYLRRLHLCGHGGQFRHGYLADLFDQARL
jgi:hypothetical protein